MPRRAASGTKGLVKHHNCKQRPADPTRCACGWSGKYRGHDVVLSKWAGCEIDPHTKDKAKAVLRRMKTAVDEERFDPKGERPDAGTDQTLTLFIDEWITHVAEAEGEEQTATSLRPMLNVIQESRLGAMSLKQLVDAVEDIQKWLNAEGKAREWKAKTWNNYHELLSRVLKQAVKWRRMASNPMTAISTRVAAKPEHFKARPLVEDAEDRLFAVVDQLNRVQHKPNRNKLTQDKADAIRKALAEGRQGKDVAAKYGVSPAIVSSIKHGDIWNPERLKVGTKGAEMRRRLIGAFDGGMRAGEMLKVKLEHVNWRMVSFIDENGQRVQGYEIKLPPDITKGGKSTGEDEVIFASSPRFRQMLESRRFQLKNNTDKRQFIFGAEDGREQKGFRRMWTELFALADLDYGRDKGLVWHTIRHEFISRTAERTKDPVLTQEIARHRQLETTQGYFHARRDRKYAAVAGMGRGKS